LEHRRREESSTSVKSSDTSTDERNLDWLRTCCDASHTSSASLNAVCGVRWNTSPTNHNSDFIITGKPRLLISQYVNIRKNSLLSFTIFSDLEEIIFEYFNVSENNIISVKWANVLG
jgi:hypothetical protein